MALPKLGMKSTTAKKNKSMKSKRVTKIARGRMARTMVLRGTKEKTVGGLTKDKLMRNKRGKVVSKLASAQGKRAFLRIEQWVESVMEARSALHSKGFVAINGKSLEGKALYVKAKAIRASKSTGRAVPFSSTPSAGASRIS